MVNGRYQKVRPVSSNEFLTSIGRLVSDPTFGLGGSRMWYKEWGQKIGGKNRKRRSIRMKVDLYEVCLSYDGVHPKKSPFSTRHLI